MANEVTNPAFQLPAHLLDFGSFSADLNSGITGGIKTGGGAHPRINIKGSKWRIEEDGVEELHNELTLDVIIVNANRNMSKVFYAGKYNPQATEFKAPDCYSDNGVGPSSQAESPQCNTCQLCPNNAWGSKVNELGNKTKACSDFKKIAVVLADDPERNVYELRIPSASLQDFNKIMTNVVNKKVPIPALIFQLSFDPNVDYPKVVFKPTKYVDEFQKQAVLDWIKSDEAKKAVGANDTPQAALAAPQAAPVVPAQVVKPVVNTVESMAMEAPRRRGRPARSEAPTQEDPTQLSILDIPGVQSAAQATPIKPAKTDVDLDALLAGVLG